MDQAYICRQFYVEFICIVKDHEKERKENISGKMKWNDKKQALKWNLADNGWWFRQMTCLIDIAFYEADVCQFCYFVQYR